MHDAFDSIYILLDEQIFCFVCSIYLGGPSCSSHVSYHRINMGNKLICILTLFVSCCLFLGNSTLESLGKYASGISSQDPMFTYYTYALNQIGRLEGAPIDGNFDGQPVEEYADTIVKDLFDAEALKPPGLGIEKEATIILGLWMRFHHHIYEVMRICRDDGSNQAQMIENLDKAVAFWIGRMQIHGDNARGTMLYNLAERSGVHFSQDQGEVPVNRKMMGAWTFFKTEIESGTCSSEDGYKMLYLEMINVEGMMNVPLVQNFIHHVISGAPLEIIELYAVSLFPQIISCDITFIDYFDDELHKLARKPRNDDNLSKAISLVRKMYGCLGLTCDDVGAHISGSACNDDELNPIRAIVGYTPNTDVRNVSNTYSIYSKILSVLKVYLYTHV
jgi:hypothetical protein